MKNNFEVKKGVWGKKDITFSMSSVRQAFKDFRIKVVGGHI